MTTCHYEWDFDRAQAKSGRCPELKSLFKTRLIFCNSRAKQLRLVPTKITTHIDNEAYELAFKGCLSDLYAYSICKVEI